MPGSSRKNTRCRGVSMTNDDHRVAFPPTRGPRSHQRPCLCACLRSIARLDCRRAGRAARVSQRERGNGTPCWLEPSAMTRPHASSSPGSPLRPAERCRRRRQVLEGSESSTGQPGKGRVRPRRVLDVVRGQHVVTQKAAFGVLVLHLDEQQQDQFDTSGAVRPPMCWLAQPVRQPPWQMPELPACSSA